MPETITHEAAAEKALADDLRDQLRIAALKAKTAKTLQLLHGWIFAAQTLCRRLEALGPEWDVKVGNYIDLARLPTFGGPIPARHVGEGIWSWDREYMLVGNCVADFRIEPRVG